MRGSVDGRRERRRSGANRTERRSLDERLEMELWASWLTSWTGTDRPGIGVDWGVCERLVGPRARAVKPSGGGLERIGSKVRDPL